LTMLPRPKQDYAAELVVSGALFVFVLILGMLSGCVPPAPRPVNPDDPVTPIVSPEPLTPRVASAAFGADLSRRLSATSADLASRAAAGEFASLADLNDEWVRRVAADVSASKRPIVEAMNATLVDETGEQPGDVAAGLFRELANGFEKGAK
jgi:hypothetical protein